MVIHIQLTLTIRRYEVPRWTCEMNVSPHPDSGPFNGLSLGTEGDDLPPRVACLAGTRFLFFVLLFFFFFVFFFRKETKRYKSIKSHHSL